MNEIVGLVAVIMGIGFVPIIVWLKLHYKHKGRSMGHMTNEQMAELERMSRIADMLDQRVNTLESILDDEVPNWRDNDDKTI
ncbi:MAG: envelope stress response membrane protein PspB [Robiginitomaculum sp.]